MDEGFGLARVALGLQVSVCEWHFRYRLDEMNHGKDRDLDYRQQLRAKDGLERVVFQLTRAQNLFFEECHWRRL